jgi:growth factor-regulated tyrosine kinase substrate
VNLHTKLNNAVKAYDKLLEERLSYAAQRARTPSYSNYYDSYSNQVHPPAASQQQYSTPPVVTNYSPYPQTPIALPLSHPTAQTPVQHQAYVYPQGQPAQTSTIQHQQPISYAAPPTPQAYQPPASQYYPTVDAGAGAGAGAGAAVAPLPQQQQPYQALAAPVQNTIPPTQQESQQYQQPPYFDTSSTPANYYNQNSTYPNAVPQQTQPSTAYNKQHVEEAPLIEL